MSTSDHAEFAHGTMDIREHVKTWAGFKVFVKWGIIVNVLILIFLAIFRTH